MLFNSVSFLIFLPVVVVLYYLLPAKLRWILLLAASYVFYGAWKIEFLSLIIFSTVVDFVISQQLYHTEVLWKRRSLLAVSFITNLGLLFVFKYLRLFLPPVEAMHVNIYTVDHPIMGAIAQGIYFAIPVGISFYTFQTMSYTLDVYFKRIVPEKHLGYFALFVSFFPQLVAGPIERFSRLMPQLKVKHSLSYANFQKAFRLMLYGFFIKMCIADNLGPLVDEVYANPNQYDGFSVWFGTLAFGLQIYTDFAGYSLIAQGAALCLGIQLIDNFKTPYFSTSISDFWSRWHISLSTWFRDYLYIPLGGNRVAVTRWVINIMLVFVISGFWHGANYTFLIWGAIHGVLYLIERAVRTGLGSKRSHARKFFAGVLIFSAVQFAWIFFRIDALSEVPNHLNALVTASGEQHLTIPSYLWVILVVFLSLEIRLYNNRFDRLLEGNPLAIRWVTYTLLLWCILAWAGVTNHPFIYFQF